MAGKAKPDLALDADEPEVLVDPEPVAVEPVRAGGFVLVDGVWKPMTDYADNQFND